MILKLFLKQHHKASHVPTPSGLMPISTQDTAMKEKHKKLHNLDRIKKNPEHSEKQCKP